MARRALRPSTAPVVSRPPRARRFWSRTGRRRLLAGALILRDAFEAFDDVGAFDGVDSGPGPDVKGSGHRMASGHWSVPGVAQVRIEAWAPTREGCVAEAAAATVDSYADVDSSVPWHLHQFLVPLRGSRQLLSGVLDEVIFDMRSVGVVPVWLRARPAEVGMYVEIGGVDAAEVRRGGDLPQSVAAKGLALRRTRTGWSASAILRH